MDVTTLENLVRGNVQIVLMVAAATVIIQIFRVSAPTIRHTFWRVVLAACLVLPFVQPWRSSAVPISQAIDIVVPAPSGTLGMGGAIGSAPALARAVRHVRVNWMAYVTGSGIAGVSRRLAWLAAGIMCLHRLRRSGQLGIATGGYHELTALIEAGAEIRRVDRLRPPGGFGGFLAGGVLPPPFS